MDLNEENQRETPQTARNKTSRQFTLPNLNLAAQNSQGKMPQTSRASAKRRVSLLNQLATGDRKLNNLGRRQTQDLISEGVTELGGDIMLTDLDYIESQL